jgi:hypothetical protein
MDAIQARAPLLSFILFLLLSAPAVAARTDWREMTVGHFHLYSVLSDSSTREMARQIQAFEQTVGEILRTDDRLPDIPTLIYILNHDDFQKYATGRAGLSGIFLARPFANFLAIDGSEHWGHMTVTVFHEYTHFIQRNSSTLKLPPWYTEGYAELFSSFQMNKNVIKIGGEPNGLAVYSDNWIPMQRILAVKHDDPEYKAEHLMPQFYGESWALVHMLLFDDKTLERPTRHYLEAMDIGNPEPEAFASSFAFDKQGLDEAVRKLLRNHVIHVKIYTFKNVPAVDEAPIIPMTRAHADAEIARLAFAMGRSPEILVPLAAQVLSEAPTDPAIRALSARIASKTDAPQDVSDLAAVLANGGITDVQQRIDVATAVMNRGPGPVQAGEVLSMLNDVAHDESPPLEAISLWAQSAEMTGITPPQFIRMLEKSTTRAPHNTQLLMHLARAQEAAGDKRQARASYDRIILVSEFPQERLWAQKQADSARLQ